MFAKSKGILSSEGFSLQTIRISVVDSSRSRKVFGGVCTDKSDIYWHRVNQANTNHISALIKVAELNSTRDD